MNLQRIFHRGLGTDTEDKKKPRHRNKHSIRRRRNNLFLSKRNFKHVGRPKETLFIGAGRFHGLRCTEGGRKSVQFVREALNLRQILKLPLYGLCGELQPA